MAKRSRFIMPPLAVDSISSTRDDGEWATACESRRSLSKLAGYGIFFGHVIREKRSISGGAGCACHRVGQAAGACGGVASGGRGRGRRHPLPFFSGGRAVGGR